MARVELMPGIESISGSVGQLTFRTMNGKTFVRVRQEAELPKGASRKQKAKYKRDRMLDQCIAILQDEMGDMLEAIRLRPKMRERLKRLYDKYAKEIKAPTKLQRKIMTEYRGRFV